MISVAAVGLRGYWEVSLSPFKRVPLVLSRSVMKKTSSWHRTWKWPREMYGLSMLTSQSYGITGDDIVDIFNVFMNVSPHPTTIVAY